MSPTSLIGSFRLTLEHGRRELSTMLWRKSLNVWSCRSNESAQQNSFSPGRIRSAKFIFAQQMANPLNEIRSAKFNFVKANSFDEIHFARLDRRGARMGGRPGL